MGFIDYAVIVILGFLILIIIAAYIAAKNNPTLEEEPKALINDTDDTSEENEVIEEAKEIAGETIKEFEGFSSKAYVDLAGIKTIGWGTTNFDKKLKTITADVAQSYLDRDINKIIEDLRKIIKVQLNKNQWAALISFVYNVGITAFRHSTLLKLINSQKNIYEIETEFLKWKHVGKKVVEGLVNRRRKEFLLFSKKVK